MTGKREAEIAVTGSSGNVFADIGLPEPEEELAKAHWSCIRQVIKRQRLTQVAAAARMGMIRPRYRRSSMAGLPTFLAIAQCVCLPRSGRM